RVQRAVDGAAVRVDRSDVRDRARDRVRDGARDRAEAARDLPRRRRAVHGHGGAARAGGGARPALPGLDDRLRRRDPARGRGGRATSSSGGRDARRKRRGGRRAGRRRVPAAGAGRPLPAPLAAAVGRARPALRGRPGAGKGARPRPAGGPDQGHARALAVSDTFFAVDVGGSSVKSALVVDGAVDAVAREPIAAGLDGLVAQLERLHPGTPAWGLCLPGQVADGRVRGAVNLGLDDAPLLELLDLPAPAAFANDLVAATTGEAAGGTLALLQVGTGIAGRFAVDGVVPPSATGLAGEVGHLTFRPGGLECSCGRRGCAEAYGGWRGIAARSEVLGHDAPFEEVLEADWAEEIRADT